MLFVSILTSDRSRDPELWATIWNGQAPPSINLIGAYNLGNDKRVYIWEGEVQADIQFMDRFNEVGSLETYPAFDRTAGWRQAFEKNIDAFSERLLKRNPQETDMPSLSQMKSGIELRTRGMKRAPTSTSLCIRCRRSRRCGRTFDGL